MPRQPPDRVFLDANVLFSAACRESSGLLRLWSEEVHRVTSDYALQEALRNLADPTAAERLRQLAADVEVVRHSPSHLERTAKLDLPEDDRPILGAAIAVGADVLLSGDRRAFGAFYGRRVSGVLVLRPGESLRSLKP